MPRPNSQKEAKLREVSHEAEVVGRELDAVRRQLRAEIEAREDFVAYLREQAEKFALNRNVHPVYLDVAARLESGAFPRRKQDGDG